MASEPPDRPGERRVHDPASEPPDRPGERRARDPASEPEPTDRRRGGDLEDESAPWARGDPGDADPLRPRPRYDWRGEVATASGLNVLAGIWLIIAPFVLGYTGGDPIFNDVVFGALIALVGLARVSGAYRETWLSWLNAVFGIWVFAAAFWIDDSGQAVGNDIILGVIVFVLAVASATASEGALDPTGGPDGPAPRRRPWARP